MNGVASGTDASLTRVPKRTAFPSTSCHGHPKGEIDMIIPETTGAKFDGQGQGWMVYEPESAHHPAATDGKVIVLYLLPEGEIDFTLTPS
jgi:hypothetical protein